MFPRQTSHRPLEANGQPEFIMGDHGFWRWRRFDEEQQLFELSRENYSSLALCKENERKNRSWRSRRTR